MNNREIKFKAWDKKNKRMATAFFIASISGLPFLTVKNNPIEIMPILSDFILLQFTGLKDENGKEIYEGDIIEYDFLPEGKDQRSEVIFRNGKFCIKDGNNYMPSGKVIGNINENKELLNK